jgi:hypothetical protein
VVDLYTRKVRTVAESRRGFDDKGPFHEAYFNDPFAVAVTKVSQHFCAGFVFSIQVLDWRLEICV